jgi:hypothetical protein
MPTSRIPLSSMQRASLHRLRRAGGCAPRMRRVSTRAGDLRSRRHGRFVKRFDHVSDAALTRNDLRGTQHKGLLIGIDADSLLNKIDADSSW